MSAAVKTDTTLAAAADQARASLEGIAEPGAVGDHLGLTMVDERLGTHHFTCTSAAYPGWLWAVTVTRVPRGKVATVCETNLVPGDGALLSPSWVPYAERLAPGDIGPGDVTPLVVDDPLLEAGFEATGDEDVDQLAVWELGLGRPRVLSAEGREAAASRWYAGGPGPSAPMATKAPAPCATCGFFLPMAGALRAVFGVCANEYAADGHVVDAEFGCGAHSDTPAAPGAGSPLFDPYDDGVLDLVERADN